MVTRLLNWKLIRIVRNVRQFFIPVGSRREIFFKRLWGAFRDHSEIVEPQGEIPQLKESLPGTESGPPEAAPVSQESVGSDPVPPPAGIANSRVVCIHPRFAGLTSHHFNESYG